MANLAQISIGYFQINKHKTTPREFSFETFYTQLILEFEKNPFTQKAKIYNDHQLAIRSSDRNFDTLLLSYFNYCVSRKNGTLLWICLILNSYLILNTM